MEKIAVITDTASDLTDEIINKYDMKVLPFRIIYKDREFKDKVDIVPEYVYENMDKEVPTSSMPSMSDMEELYETLKKEGYTHAIIITISSALSGFNNGAKLVSDGHPEIKTVVWDSKSISLGEGKLAEECAKLVEQGKSFDEIVALLPHIMERIHTFFVVPTLEYLKKGGRIGRVSGTIAELLDIKPIITPDSEGKYSTYAKCRGRKQSINKLASIAKELLKEKKARVYIMHGYAEEDAMKFAESLKGEENAIEVTVGGQISPVSGVHSGPGLVGLVLVEE